MFFLIFGDTLFMNFKVTVKVTRSSTLKLLGTKFIFGILDEFPLTPLKIYSFYSFMS